MYSRVVVTGSIAYDEIMVFPGFFKDYFHPEKLHQISVSFVLSSLEKQLGGTATNIAYNASLFNVPVEIRGAVGKDGQDFLDFYRKRNIVADRLITDKRLYTSTGKVMTDRTDNQIWGFYYGAAFAARKISFKDLTKRDLLVISANHRLSFLNVQRQAIVRKLEYIYDPGMALTWINDKDLARGIGSCRYLVGNDYEMAMIEKRLGKPLNKLRKRGQVYITTLGEKGATCLTDKETFRLTSFSVKKITDPTGAGDAWRGGFAASLVLGYDLSASLRFANALASYAIEKYGTVNHRPLKKDIERRAKTLRKKAIN